MEIRLARYVIRRLPFLMLALKGVWLALAAFGVYVGDFWVISEIQAHSVFFCLVLAYYAYVGRHCLYLWVCIFALLGLNILNIIYYFFNYNYLTYYSAALIIAGLTFSAVYAIRKVRHT